MGEDALLQAGYEAQLPNGWLLCRAIPHKTGLQE